MQGLPLNKAHIIFGWIFSVLLSDFKARILRSISTPPMMAVTGFFNADAETNPLPV